MNNVLKIWTFLQHTPVGKWTFSKLISVKAPYFKSISAIFEQLEPHYCKIKLKKQRAVLNHIGTVHAIAMCNMAELAGGAMTEVSIPQHYRWIPKGMTVEYLKKAETDLVAIATPADHRYTWSANSTYVVKVEVLDASDQLVFRALISMWISQRK